MSTYETLKIPPHSIEAEQSVLGGLMLDTGKWSSIHAMLGEDDFYRQDHRLIFRAIKATIESGHKPDVVVMSHYLKSIGHLEDAGGLAYLGTMANNTPSAANIVAYAEIVKEKAMLRAIISTSTDVADHAFASDADPAELINRGLGSMLKLSNAATSGKQTWVAANNAMKVTLNRIQELASRRGLRGLSTGITELDEALGGLEEGKLIYIGGRPAMGKTALALNFAVKAALQDAQVAIFSMEMPLDDLWERIYSHAGRVDYGHIRKPWTLTDDDWLAMTNATKRLKDKKIHIDESPALSVNEIRARVRQLEAKTGEPTKVVVLDYIQLMSLNKGEKAETGNATLTRISNGLMQLKKELNCTIVALSQLNRSLEQRPNKRPLMSDLRESGALEQDGDAILFVYRDEVYDDDSPDKGIAELILAKNRAGLTKTIKTAFLGKYQSFETLEYRYNNMYEAA